MPTITQIQVVREGEVTTIYALDTEGRLWRGQPLSRVSRGSYEIKWLPIVDTDERLSRTGARAYHGGDPPRRPQIRMSRLVIISRKHPDLHAHLTGPPFIARPQDIEVVLDRRHGDRRQQSAPPANERRQADRRQPSSVDADLASLGIAIVHR
jgi:hypothetical protein